MPRPRRGAEGPAAGWRRGFGRDSVRLARASSARPCTSPRRAGLAAATCVSSPIEWRRIDCADRTENSSPVMKVWKPATVPSSDLDPFRMRSRHAGEMPARGEPRHGARELGFLAAHDIGPRRVALRQTGHDADIARHARHAGRTCENRPASGRHVDIGHLGPALAGARHAADDGGQRQPAHPWRRVDVRGSRRSGLAARTGGPRRCAARRRLRRRRRAARCAGASCPSPRRQPPACRRLTGNLRRQSWSGRSACARHPRRGTGRGRQCPRAPSTSRMHWRAHGRPAPLRSPTVRAAAR